MKPLRHDQDRFGSGILVYVRERTSIKELRSYKPPNDIECGLFELTVKSQKWIFISIYRPPSQPEQYFFCEIGKALDHFLQNMKTSFLSETPIVKLRRTLSVVSWTITTYKILLGTRPVSNQVTLEALILS